MRKLYIRPSVKTMECESDELMYASGVYSDKGIDYGGVDEDGSREASSRQLRSVWEDE